MQREDVLTIIKQEGPMTVDTLSRWLGIPPVRAAGFISSLYIRGEIRKTQDGGRWEACR